MCEEIHSVGSAAFHGGAKGKSKRSHILPFYFLLFTFALSSCAVGPDFQKPASPEVAGYTPGPLPAQTASGDVHGGEAQRLVQEMDIPAQWWTLFHSKPLSGLVEQAIKKNPDLESAQAALRVARENVYAQEGALWPSVAASYNASQQKVPGQLGAPTASGAYTYSLHTAQVTVAYTPDVFGGTRRQIESLEAQAGSQRFQLEATYLTLSSNVVAAAIQEAGLRGQIAATKKIIDIEIHSLELLKRQYSLGQVAKADVVAQEAALSQAQATLPPLEKQLAQQRDLLSRLAGRFPTDALTEQFEISSLELPQELPVSLPSKLVEQRPDVRSAEELMHSAGAQIGVAVANRLPNIPLSADIGSSATQIAQLFTPGTGFWTLAANVTQPIFQGGTLLHRQRAAEEAYKQAEAQYRSTVLTAFQNVADALYAIQSDADAVKAALAAEKAAAQSLDIARRQLELGDISYLALLNAEQTYQQASLNLAQALSNRYADTAALFQALGGGWWNRSDVPARVGG
ncbi:putative efflux pump outer membrane [Syntrophobacter sp. SbD1]|nr:putative efflux pump outer membrane [Syntrophobacter sp. SbD1]